MDIGREVRRYRAEPVISPVPGAEAPVEEPAVEQAPAQVTVPAPDVEPVPDRGGVALPS